MSKSFDDKIKEKLSGYEVAPPADAKNAIIGSGGGISLWSTLYQVTGTLLLVLAFYMFGYQHGAKDQNVASKEVNRIIIDKPVEDLNQLPIDIPAKPQVFSIEKNVKPVLNTEEEILPLVTDNENEQLLSDFATRDIDPIGFTLSNVTPKRHLRPAYFTRIKEVVPKHDKYFNPYFDAGAFFLYNRLVPNLNDEIYVGNYEAPFSLSAARLGASLVAGLERNWSEKLSTRLGLVFNNYNQHFSFTVRHTKPDSVVVTSDLIQPIFNEQNIQIRKRISTLGLRLQNTWAFPTKYNSIYLSAEYHRRIGKGAEFQFDGNTHSLSPADMWMMEFGLRKQLMSFKNGDLYVIPGIRYSVSKIKEQGILNVKPFSAGVSVSYTLK